MYCYRCFLKKLFWNLASLPHWTYSENLCLMMCYAEKFFDKKIIKKQTFNQVVFSSIIHISTRHEQMCLMRLHFERYLPYHQYMVGDDGRGTSRNVTSLNTFLLDMIDCEHSKRSLIKRIVSWHGKRWALNRQTKVILSIHVSV